MSDGSFKSIRNGALASILGGMWHAPTKVDT